ncbi:hypothetical protein EDD18DRAFT_62311 [Armillaria luteobubalina]|uniref:DUF6534 domain-containing protein n=1 Tax=Armillaria luteobubalina TaxID=153913 RepID=A0AA39QCB6_9AGAR|nr:hypothetical protein EDD18DRAFT_62311 [Armillaria luteobubalina]
MSKTISISAIYGRLMISFAVDLIFYGVSLILVLQYFRSSAGHDRFRTCAVVFLLVFFSTIQIGAFSEWIYESLILHFHDLETRDYLPPAAVVLLFGDYIVSFIAQCFFVSQIWTISQSSLWYTTPVGCLALVNLGSAIAQIVTVARRSTLSGMDNKIDQILAIMQTSVGALCDVSITATLCFLLYRNRTGLKSTETMIDSLIILIVNRGLATSMTTLLGLVLYLAPPFHHTMTFMIPMNVGCQLHVISVVGSLNYRHHVRTLARKQIESSWADAPDSIGAHSSVDSSSLTFSMSHILETNMSATDPQAQSTGKRNNSIRMIKDVDS